MYGCGELGSFLFPLRPLTVTRLSPITLCTLTWSVPMRWCGADSEGSLARPVAAECVRRGGGKQKRLAQRNSDDDRVVQGVTELPSRSTTEMRTSGLI